MFVLWFFLRQQKKKRLIPQNHVTMLKDYLFVLTKSLLTIRFLFKTSQKLKFGLDVTCRCFHERLICENSVHLLVSSLPFHSAALPSLQITHILSSDSGLWSFQAPFQPPLPVVTSSAASCLSAQTQNTKYNSSSS